MGSSKMVKAIKKLGYKTVDEYFFARPGRLFADMANELGVSKSTVSKHYQRFLDRQSGVGK